MFSQSYVYALLKRRGGKRREETGEREVCVLSEPMAKVTLDLWPLWQHCRLNIYEPPGAPGSV